MSFSAINPILLAASLMVASTPILLAALGEMVVEKAGVLNLGVEGMMITGAVVGFAVGVNTASPGIGFVAAAAAGAGLSLLFGLITQFLKSNQVATGLALTLFGLGLSSLIGKPYEGMKSATLGKLDAAGPGRSAGARPDPVPPRPDGLSLAVRGGRGLGRADATPAPG